MGFGVVREGGPVASHMKYVHVDYVPDSVCEKVLTRETGKEKPIIPEQICAGGEVDEDGCQVDTV